MRFFIVMLTILVSSSWLVFYGLLIPIEPVYPSLFAFHGAAYALGLLALLLVVLSWRKRGTMERSTLLLWASRYLFSFMGIHSLLFAALVVEGIVLIASPFTLAQAALGSLAWAYGLAALGLLYALRGPKFERHAFGRTEEPSPPLRIAQISDLHIGATLGAAYVKRVVDQVLEEKPDLIVLTGDIGDGDPHRHARAVAELSRLDAPLGVYAVLGNHELYHHTMDWIRSFQDAGFELLQDEVRELKWQDKPFRIVGLSPAHGMSADELITEGPPALVLSHYPERAEESAEAGASLFLAGHTHGGQFWPWSWFIHLVHRHAKGAYRLKEMDLYVSRGTGYWGPPLRFGARPEILIAEWSW